MSYESRPATLSDLDILVSFVLAEANEAEGASKVPDTVRKGIRVGLEQPDVARYWVLEKVKGGSEQEATTATATIEKQVVASVSIIREWSDWHASYYWWIQSMFILPNYRGQGLMKPLLEAVKEAAKAEQALELRLYVHRDNQRAIRAYQREGFAASVYVVVTLTIE